MSQFLISPWEHALSGALAKPHATARAGIGGKSRNFVLKMHDGVLFWKEPSRAPIFAVTEVFDESLAHDAIGLVSRWQSELAKNNFGVLVSKRDYFPKLTVRGQISMIVKSDGSGWMKEHFDEGWFSLPEDGAERLDVWNEKEVEAHIRERFPFVQRALINRAISADIFEREAPMWKSATGETISALLVAAARLFLDPSTPWNDDDWRVLKIKSHSAFARGDIEGRWRAHALHSPPFAAFWEHLEPCIQFVGVRWTEGGEQIEQYARARNKKVFAEGLEKWGHLWRGNWAPQRASFSVQLPNLETTTAHEKLEAALVLRDWLRLSASMSEGQIEKLLAAP